MFCSNCGTQLPDEANFCWKCGKPQKTGVQVDEPKWETCEIVYADIRLAGPLSRTIQFWAKAVGPLGVYNAGESTKVKAGVSDSYEPCEWNNKHVTAVNSLVAQLAKDNWQPLPRGQYWYSYRFQRQVK